MTRPLASIDPFQRARQAADDAVADWLVENGYSPATLGVEALTKGYSPELADAICRIVLEVALAATRLAVDATWPHAKRAYRPPTENGRDATGDWVNEHPPGKWFASDPSVGPHRFSPVQGTRRYCLLFIGPNTICGKEQDDPIHQGAP